MSQNTLNKELLARLPKGEFEQELRSIADWWIDNTYDQANGGFVGEISASGEVHADKPKGIILNTRILWFFSDAALYLKEEKYTQAAERAFHYLRDHFVDQEHGGVLWELDAQGACTNGRKQIYAQAFAVYAFSAYYKLTQNAEALSLAYAIFDLIEAHGQDKENGGYFEAFSAAWGELDDIRLSEKDLDSPKTMNTHLHVLEAYTTLYSVEQNARVGDALRSLLLTYEERFVNNDNNHLRMFLGLDWSEESQAYSYGHDIESSWLMWEAVEVLNDKALEESLAPVVLALADSCMAEGLADDGSVVDLYDFETKQNILERVWWVQAEALVGFLNACQMTGDSKYIDVFLKIWEFTKASVIDSEKGEWHWVATIDQEDDYHEYKVGFWKGPYHNGRAMLELCRRLGA